jgi:myo-inositol-1(or 4)-monophosphatase
MTSLWYYIFMDEYKKVAIEAAREAGALALSLSQHKINYQSKGTYDILAEADTKSENLIIKKIKENFPTHSILSEESGEKDGETEFLWVIDPVDGTINFERHINEYCVSIALEQNGELVLGVIYQVATDKMFVAIKGQGAYLNEKRISVSDETELINTLFATENSSKMDIRMEDFEILLKICEKIRGVRIFGSGALHLAAVCEGHIDFYYKTRFNYWDIAAGTVLIREAGGKVTDFEGNELNRESKNIITSNSVLHPQVLELVNSAYSTL